MEQVSIVGIDLTKYSYLGAWGACGWVGHVQQEAEPGEAARVSCLTAALRGGDGGLCERPLLGP